MKIGIDLMGGDHPHEIIKAINKYVNDNKNDQINIYAIEGTDLLIKLEKKPNVNIIYCNSQVEKDDDPAFVVRTKKDSTLIVGAKDLHDNKIDSFISAGSTGALVAAGLFVVKRLKSVSKPALPGFIPKPNSNIPVMLLDLGANINATEKNLLEYAAVAKEYMKNYYNIPNPSIKLLNNGVEENKGIDLYKNTYKTLFEDDNFNFKGNIEARDILQADCDIILMDGWTGNIMLKSIEGTVGFLGKEFKQIFYKRALNKMAALILKKDLKELYYNLDYRELGATPVLGVNGLLLKAHGSSKEMAFYNAFKQAKQLYENNFLDNL